MHIYIYMKDEERRMFHNRGTAAQLFPPLPFDLVVSKLSPLTNAKNNITA